MADVLTGKNGDTEKPSFLKKKKLPTKYLIPMWRRKAAQQAKAPSATTSKTQIRMSAIRKHPLPTLPP